MKISVAMASYNGAEFLADQLASIDCQRRPRGIQCEIVVADDCSTDATLDLLRSTRLSNTELRVLPAQAKCGVAGTFERAISGTDGDVIFLCDQDDVWAPDKVQHLLSILNQGNDLAYSGYWITDSALKIRRVAKAFPLGRDCLVANTVPGMTMAFRREIVPAILPFGGYIHDWWIAIIAYAALRVGHWREPLTYYRQHGGNAIGLGRRRGDFPEMAVRRARFYGALSDRLAGIAVASSGRHVVRLRELSEYYDALANGRTGAVSLRVACSSPRLFRSLIGSLRHHAPMA